MTPNEERQTQPATVLLAVTGMSPAVLTETVWALAHEAEAVIPSRVVVITTLLGKREIERQLFQPLARFEGRTAWDSLRDQLTAAGHCVANRLLFGTTGTDIRVITSIDLKSGCSRELEDLRTPADNEAAADFLLEQIRSVVENPDAQLVASIAGGRKTMGALLYACLTLAGRDTDRLTHVLVNEPFESAREFYFPGQPGGPIARTNSNSTITEVDPKEARVDLADVPFVALRNLCQRDLGRKVGTFSRLVESCRDDVRRRAAETLRLTVDTGRAELDINGTKMRLAPTEHLVLVFLARRTKQGEPPYPNYKDAENDLNTFRMESISQPDPNDFGDWRRADSLRTSFDEQSIRKAVSGIRTKLRERGGDAAALASCLPEKGRCSIDLERSLIFIK